MLFATPAIDADDDVVLAQIDSFRRDLAEHVRTPRRWTGGLRRTTQARAIQGSNTIEGYTVSDEDALAAVDDEEPLTTDERTWAEIVGYRRVLTFILSSAGPELRVDAQTLRMLHFMLLEHELGKGPGRFRAGPVYVERAADGRRVYEGPDAAVVAGLVDELCEALAADEGHPMVRAAMAHLNLVMIHPFKDGNGRMARALQTLVLAHDAVLEPTFSSIEEWLGHNTDAYYRVLAVTGRGRWQPHRDAGPWLKFNLRAHHMQAQTLSRRVDEAQQLGLAVQRLVEETGLPERVFDPLFDAAIGARVRRPTYVRRSGIEERTATRDLKALVDAGLLAAIGQTRGRTYVAAGALAELRRDLRATRRPVTDPYPDLITLIERSH